MKQPWFPVSCYEIPRKKRQTRSFEMLIVVAGYDPLAFLYTASSATFTLENRRLVFLGEMPKSTNPIVLIKADDCETFLGQVFDGYQSQCTCAF